MLGDNMDSNQNELPGGKSIQHVISEWHQFVSASTDKDESHTREVHMKSWKYRWKRFRPPNWKIFRWAFKCTRHVVLKGVYFAGISTDTKSDRQ